jgi:hypothetical protein
MSMNLMQIQDKLKGLPNDPRVMQLLTSYANGQNPQVPPYLALGELNRRKVEAERAQMEQAGQPPGGTVKDQIQQQAGVMALKQGQQQQAMQRMAQQGMQGGAPVPQGTPQPQPQAQAMAAGGLASLAPKGYRSGGIVAFSRGGLGEGEDEGGDGLNTNEEEKAVNLPADPRELMARLMQEVVARRSMQAPSAETPLESRKRMIAADPDRYGILNTPVGADALKRLEEVQGARRAELATQKEELAKSKPGILQLLGQAAMGSRGQQGKSALASILGGYSELSSGADAKQLQQEQGLRMRELELQQAKAEAMNKVDDLRRAQAEGDIAGEQKAKMELARIAKDHNVSINNLLGKQLTTAGALVESQRKSEDTTRTIKSREDVAEARRKLDERLENIRSNRPGEKERILRQIDRLRKEGKTAEADQLLEDLRYLQGSAVGVNLARNERLIIEAQLKSANNVLTNQRSTPAEIAAAKTEIAELNKQLKGLRTKPDDDKPKPIQVPQSLPSGLTAKNASTMLKVGTVYDTAAGPGKWNGTGFDPVQ